MTAAEWKERWDQLKHLREIAAETFDDNEKFLAFVDQEAAHAQYQVWITSMERNSDA